MDERKNLTTYRVIYGDADSMGIVYYANYPRLFEIGRTEFLRELGVAYKEVEREGFFLPVTEAFVKYLAPARYDDVLAIETRIGFIKRASSRFEYRIHRDQETIVQGYTVHACLDSENRIVRLPGILHDVLKR